MGALRLLTYRVVLLFALLAMIAATSAYADSFDFSYGASGIAATGTFYTDSLLNGSFLITGISGTRNGQVMTLLAPNAFDGNDNLLFPNTPFLDFNGFSFEAGGIDYNVYFNSIACCGGSQSYYETSIPGVLGPQITFSAIQTTEPSSLMLLGSSALGVLSVFRRKRLA